MKSINMVDTKDDVDDAQEAVAALCEKLGDLTSLDEYDTDDDEYSRQIFTTTSIIYKDMDHPIDNDEGTLVIRAHLEYTKSGDRHYAISDSGADSSILGIHCKVVSYTGRHAYLIGYDPATTKSAKIPIISGYIKVMSQVNIPIVLLIHEAPYNANSPVTLLSEYQARDYGTIIDSISKRHKTISGTHGTQRMLVSPDVYVPFVDRGGLMGFEVLPWKNGDEERYEVFTITSEARWTPRRYLEDAPKINKNFWGIYVIPHVRVTHQEQEDGFQDTIQDTPVIVDDNL